MTLKKSGGEIPERDEQRKSVPNVSSSPLTDPVSPSFDSHPLCFSEHERIRHKKKVNKLDGALHVPFVKDVTVFHFDPEDVVKCNFVFPDGWRQQH